jgi:signal transduction histidine kinase
MSAQSPPARRSALHSQNRGPKPDLDRSNPIGVVVRDTVEPPKTGDGTFESLLSGLSSEFISVRADRVDATIDRGLRELAECIDVDRAVFAQFHHHNQILVTHCYSVPGLGHLPPRIVDDALPWLARMLRDGRIVRLTSPADLPLDATNERRWCQVNGVGAHVSIPCGVGGLPLCAIAFSSRTERQWPDKLIERLRLFGDVFANALSRKVTEERLQRTREELAHVVRVSTVGQLATSIAHEINQPLCAIINNAYAAMELLAASSPDRKEIHTALRDIIEDAKRGGEVVARSHSMLKRHSVDYTPQNMMQLIEGVRMVVASYALIRHVHLGMTLVDVPPVLGHGVQIQQVITNLLVNAIDAIGSDQALPGRVDLSLHLDTSADQVIVRVSDNGVGIPADVAAQIFEPFFTTKPKGLGMGLSIARAIVESHGGMLWMEPNPDRGVTFSLSLPAHNEDRP